MTQQGSASILIIFLTIGYVTHSLFIHLCITNVNWVFNISKKNIYLGILVYHLGIFVNVKTYLPIDTFYSYCSSEHTHKMLLKIDFLSHGL